MDLAERRCGQWLPLEVREQLVGEAPELGPHHLGDLRELHPLRRLREQPRHHAARFLGQRVGIHRERLTEFERRAFELPEGGEDALARLAQIVARTAGGGELAPRLRRQEVPRGSRRQIREPAEPSQPARGNVFVVGHSRR